MKVLVTGGAGYIGSVTSELLLDAGHEVVVFDNLERGHRQAIDARAAFVEGDLRERRFDSRRHARCQAGCRHAFRGLRAGRGVDGRARSCTSATTWWAASTWPRPCSANGVDRIVFSSTCATYGQPDRVPITEDDAAALRRTRTASPSSCSSRSSSWYQRAARPETCLPAVLQCLRGHGEVRRGPRPGNPPDSHRPAGGSRAARPGQHLRR